MKKEVTHEIKPILQECGKYICQIVKTNPDGPCIKATYYVRGPFYQGQGINKAYEYDTYEEAFKAGEEFIKPDDSRPPSFVDFMSS